MVWLPLLFRKEVAEVNDILEIVLNAMKIANEIFKLIESFAKPKK